MSFGPKSNGDKPSHQTKTIDDLFGLEDEPADDPFNQLGDDGTIDDAGPEQDITGHQADEAVNALEDDVFAGIGAAEDEDVQLEELAHATEASQIPSAAVEISSTEVGEPRDQDLADEDDPFAGIAEAAPGEDGEEPATEVRHPDEAQLGALAADGEAGEMEHAEGDDPFAGIGEASEEVGEGSAQPELPALTAEVDQAELDRQKYYRDLLAEFEDDVAPSPAVDAAADIPSTTSISSSHSSPPVQALFGDEASPFDDFLGADDTPTTPGPGSAPDLSIENSPVRQHPGDASVQSLFSNASDWLGDTTVDESFNGVGEGSEPLAPALSTAASAPADEEDVEVPEGWIDEYGNFEYYTPEDREAVRESMLAERAAARALAPPVEVRQPAPYVSENAARRTPQPDHPAQFTSTPTQLPYAPPVFSRHSTGLPTPSSQPQPTNAYTPTAQSSNVYTPSSSAQSSYFPPTQPAPYSPAPASYDPYAPQPFAPNSKSIPPSQPRGPASKPAPPKPQRVMSNAYDPPFLRPQKSFVRPATAAPAFPPPMPILSTPPAPAPAPLPPSGPPRRTPSVPPASSLGLSRTSPSMQASVSAYEPSKPSPYDSNAYSSAPTTSAPSSFINAPPSRPTSQASQRKLVAPNAFDPPLRPPSVSRAVSRSAPTPPPPVPPISLPPPPSGPSRPSSRGGQKRGTPMFEAPPPLPVKRAPTMPVSVPDDRFRQPIMPPARAPTPEQRPVEDERQSGVPRDAGWPHLSSAEDDEMAAEEPEVQLSEVARAVEEEDDPEGGRWAEEEDDQEASRQMDFGEEDGYPAPLVVQSHPAPPSIPPVQQSPRQPPPPIARQASYDPYAPSAQTQVEDAYAPTQTRPSMPPATPKQAHHTPLFTSPPKTRPPIPSTFTAPTQDPYAPSSSSYQSSETAYQPQQPSYQPAGVCIPVQPPTPYMPSSDPYAPSDSSNLHAPNRSLSPAQSSSLYAPNRSISPAQSSHLSASPQNNNYFQSMPVDTSYVPQQVLEQRPVSEDPLGRCTLSAKNAPLAIFGFGGVLVTAFPAAAEESDPMGHNRTPSYGYASGRGQLLIRPLGTVMESSLGKSDTAPFPGPLLLDPSNPKGSAGDKKKKQGVLAYLDARADEIERGLPYLKSSASGARREEEGKLLLVRLLSALVVGEGKFTGSPAVEEAMKKALATPSESHPLITPGHLASASFSQSAAASSKPLSAPGQLSTLSNLLVSGDKRDAVEYAASHGMWSHALVIASSLGPEVWKETMGRFVKEELSGEGVAGLKASYSLFAGSDASIVDELFAAANVTADPSKDHWREVIASIVFNGRPTDLACLDELGGRFSQRGLLNVAHACSLLSSTSPFIDPGPTAFERPIAMVQDTRNPDAAVFAEIAEYARGMLAVPKGLEVPFPGLPGLLPYKLQRAWQAAEQGDVDLAKRYCNAVEATSKLAKTGPSLLLPHHISSLEDLLERLTGSPSIEPAKGLSARKQTAKPGLDKLGSWIGGRITTFIAGEDDTSTTTAAAPKVVPTAKGTLPAGVVGPFSHFSTISPAPSTDVSRNGSLNDFASAGNGYLGVGSRSGAASFGMPSPQAEVPPSGGYSAWGSEAVDAGGEDEQQADDGVAELLTPMAAMTFGAPASANYAPKAPREEEDDEDDLGFGNAGLSRDRTPKPENPDGGKSAAPEPAAGKKGEETKGGDEGSLSKDDVAKAGGWFKGWWGKKEGEAAGPGPIRAKLGEENAMVFDKELRRWVVKGQKPEAAPAAPPPPPRSQTVSPSKASRPPSSNGSASPGFSTMPRSVSGSGTPTNPSDIRPPRGAPQPRSGLAESVTAEQAPPAAAALSMPKPPAPAPAPAPGPGGMGRPPGGPPGMPKPPQGASIDDLLSRPPSKRPASAASKKGARNRYVDVFQQPAEK